MFIKLSLHQLINTNFYYDNIDLQNKIWHSDALKEHQDSLSIGDCNTTNLNFADNVNGLFSKEEELVSLMNNLDETLSR